MAQIISSSSSSLTNRKSPTSVPLPSSSKGSSLIGPKPQSPRDLALDTEVPPVAINFSGTSPSSDLPPPSGLSNSQPIIHMESPTLTQLREQDRHSSEFKMSVLVGLGFGSDLGIVSGSIAQARRRCLEDDGEGEGEEEGSDLGLVNVSPITSTASGLASPTEETFARATQHLRRDSDATKKREDILRAEIETLEIRKKEEQRPRVVERESSEDVIVVPDLRQNFNVERGVSAAEQRRRRRRLERRQSAANTPVVSPEVVQRGWGRRG